MKYRKLKEEEYPKPLADLVKRAKRILDDDDLACWMLEHSTAPSDYLEFIDKLDDIVTQPFYEKIKEAGA